MFRPLFASSVLKSVPDVVDVGQEVLGETARLGPALAHQSS